MNPVAGFNIVLPMLGPSNLPFSYSKLALIELCSINVFQKELCSINRYENFN